VAQTRSWDFKSDDDTLTFNQAHLMEVASGVYGGCLPVPGSSGGMWVGLVHAPHPSKAALITGIDGASSISATRTFTSATGGFNTSVPLGSLLRVMDAPTSGDNGDYIVVARNDTVITVHRDWPAGSLSSLRFEVYEPLGVVRTTEGLVVHEGLCQDNLVQLSNGGARSRIVRLVCRYTYNAGEPANTAAYLQLEGAIFKADAADGVTSGTRTFASAGGGLNAYAPGDFLRIKDADDVASNADWEILEVVDDNTVIITGVWPAALTGLTFTVYAKPAMAASDTLLAEVEVAAAQAVLLASDMRPVGMARLVTSPVEFDRQGVLDPGVYHGLDLVAGSGASDISLLAGDLVTKRLRTAKILAQTDVATPALAAAGKHRYDLLVALSSRDLGTPAALTFGLVTGTEVVTTLTPVLPTDAAVFAAHGDLVYVNVLGVILVDEAALKLYSAPKVLPVARAYRVSDGLPGFSGRSGTYYGPTGLRRAVSDLHTLVQADALLGGPQTRDLSQPFTLDLDGVFDIHGQLAMPSMVELRGAGAPAVLVGHTDECLAWKGRTFVGDDVVATFASVLQGDPTDAPAGFDLFQVTIDAAYQTGDALDTLALSRWDPAQLRFDANTSLSGWVHAVISPWVVNILLPDTFNTALNKGDLRLGHRTCGLRDVSILPEGAAKARLRTEDVDGLSLIRVSAPSLKTRRIRSSLLDVTMTAGGEGLTATELGDFPSEPLLPNDYSLVIDDVDCVMGAVSEGSFFRKLDLRASAARTWTFAEAYALYGLVRMDARHADADADFTAGTGCLILDIRLQSTNLGTPTYPTDALLSQRVLDNQTLNNSDRGTIVATATVLSWDGSVFTFGDLNVLYPGKAYTNVLLATATAIADGSALWAVLDRTQQADVSGFVGARSAVPVTDTALLIGYRLGTDLYLWDGSVLAPGDSARPGVITVADRTVTAEKLEDTALALALQALADGTAKPVSPALVTPSVPFANAGGVDANYASATGWVTYVSSVSLASVQVEDVLLVGPGRLRILEVDDVGNRVRVPAGKSGYWTTITTVAPASPFKYSVVRGDVVWRNTGLDTWTYSDHRVSGTDGATSTSGTDARFTSAGASFTTDVEVGSLLALYDSATLKDASNGYWRVNAVIDDTNLEVEGAWPDDNITTIDYEVVFGKVTLPAGTKQGLVPGLLFDDGSETHTIRGVTSDTVIVVDYGSGVATPTPSVETEGQVRTDPNPRALPMDDGVVAAGVERLNLAGPWTRVLGSRRSFYTGQPQPEFRMDADPRVILRGGGFQLNDERGLVVGIAELAGQEIELTYFGTVAWPRISDTQFFSTCVLIDGIDQVAVPSDEDLELHPFGRGASHLQAWTSTSRTPPPELGVHTLTIRLGVRPHPTVDPGSGDFVLEGFDIAVDHGSALVVEKPGTVFVGGRPYTQADIAAVALPSLTYTRGARVVRYAQDTGSRAWAVEEGRSIADLGADAVGTDTLDDVTADPALAGLRPGDIIALIGAAAEELAIIEALPSADTIVLEAATSLNEASITVRYRGRRAAPKTGVSAFADIHRYEEPVRVIPIISMGNGTTVNTAKDAQALPTAADDPMLWVDEDGSTAILAEKAYHALVSNGDYRGVAFSEGDIEITWVGTGLDLWGEGYYLPPWDVELDGLAVGKLSFRHNDRDDSLVTSLPFGPLLIPVVADLPYGTHVLRLSTTVGASSTFHLQALVVYAQKRPAFTGTLLAEGFMPALVKQSRTDSIDDPGDGLIRHHAARELSLRDASEWAYVEDLTKPHGVRAEATASGEGEFRFWGRRCVVWGQNKAGDQFDYDDGTLFDPEDLAGPSTDDDWGWHTVAFSRTAGAGDDLRVEAIDVEVPFHTPAHLSQPGLFRKLPQLLSRAYTVASADVPSTNAPLAPIPGMVMPFYVEEDGLYTLDALMSITIVNIASNRMEIRVDIDGAWEPLQTYYSSTDDQISPVVQFQRTMHMPKGWHWFALSWRKQNGGAVTLLDRRITVRRVS
jgi:hypothetical protein